MEIVFPHEKFIIDEHGKRTAVVLDIEQYQKLLEFLENLEDSRYVKEHKDEEQISFDEFLAQLKEENLV